MLPIPGVVQHTIKQKGKAYQGEHEILLVTSKRNIPIGANRTKISRSFIDTCINAQLRLALVRNVQTRTIAVQGASARIIIPIMYSCCSFSGIHEEKTIVMKNQAMRAIVKGLIPQLMNHSVGNRSCVFSNL